MLTVVGIHIKLDERPDAIFLGTERLEHCCIGHRTTLRLSQSSTTLKGEGHVGYVHGNHCVFAPAVEGVFPSVQGLDVRIAKGESCENVQSRDCIQVPLMKLHIIYIIHKAIITLKFIYNVL